MVIGSISTFDPSVDRFDTYEELFNYFCVSNDITGEKKKSAFLTCIGTAAYSKVKDLIIPKKVEESSYEDIVTILSEHYKPSSIEIAEHYKFFKRTQGQGESVMDFLAELKKIAVNCNFGAYLPTALRDQIVCGMTDSKCQHELLCKSDLTLEIALQHAKAFETVGRESQLIHADGAAAFRVTDRSGQPGSGRWTAPVRTSANRRPDSGQRTATPQGSGQRTAAPQGSGQACWRCGARHGGTCRFKDYRCHSCGTIGHLSRCCKQGRDRRANFVLDDDQGNPTETLQLDNISDSDPVYMVRRTGVSVPPIWCPVVMQGKRVDMELDTGAGVTIIDEHTYLRLCSRPKLQTCTTTLRSYSGDSIPVLGEFHTDVMYNGSVHRNLPVLVVKGSGPSLMGRNWLHLMKINWSEVHALRAPAPTPAPARKAAQPTVDATQTSQPVRDRIKRKYAELFLPQLGELKGVRVHLDIDPSVRPKFCKARSIPYAYKAKVEEQLDTDIANGVLMPVKDSRWAAPIVPVVRPDGNIRVCANFKLTANTAVRMDRYPLPKTEDLLSTLRGQTIFSKLDLAQAYNQIAVHEDSREILTINTSRGLLRYARIPFGVNVASGIFQREMEKVLAGIPGVVVFLDDVLLGSETPEQHWALLDIVCRRLQEAGLRVREKKCLFFQKQVEYLGHHISADGIRANTSKVEAILAVPIPKTVKELKSFLGLISYYSRFVPDRALILSPLYDLLNKDSVWHWGQKEMDSFNRVKEKLASNTLLVHYDNTKQLVLTCDASSVGVGAVLSQMDDSGREMPIAFASRRLSQSESRYAQIEREGLGIIFGITKFHNYLCGVSKSFVLITDHKPLIKLFGEHEGLPEMTAARIRRWALKLSCYNYVIRFRPTGQMGNADALSRLPVPTEVGARPEELVLLVDDDLLDNDELVLLADADWLDAKAIALHTSRDPVLSKVLRWVQFADWPMEVSSEFKHFVRRKNELTQTAGVLLWGHRVVAPKASWGTILGELHISHPGMRRMKSLARSIVWWPGIDGQIEQVVRNCSPCQQSRPKPPHAELHPWPWPTRPWARIHCDFAEPVRGKYVFCVVDAHSKWVEAEVLSSTASAPAIASLRRMFARWGLPDTLVSDNATTFTSEEFQRFLTGNGISHRTIEPRHSQGNGMAERVVKEVKLVLQRDSGDGWELALSKWLLRQRTTQHSTTTVTPAELMLGRKLKTRLDRMYPDLYRSVSNAQSMQKENHDRTARPRHFSISDPVLVRNYGQGSVWLPGVIVGVDGPVSFVVKLHDGRTWRRHADQMLSAVRSTGHHDSATVAMSPPPDPVAPPVPVEGRDSILRPTHQTLTPDTGSPTVADGGALQHTPTSALSPEPRVVAPSPLSGEGALNSSPPALRRSGRERRAPDFYQS